MKEDTFVWFAPATYKCPECGWVSECYPNCPIYLETKYDWYCKSCHLAGASPEGYEIHKDH
jgi:primosomal protein N'